MDIIVQIPEEVSEVLLSEGTNKQKTNRLKMLDYSGYQIKYYLKLWTEKDKEPLNVSDNVTPLVGSPTINKEFKNNKGSIEIVSTTIKTIDEGIAAANIDFNIWEVESAKVGSWNTTMKIDDAPVQVVNYKVQIKLKAIVKNHVKDTFEKLFELLPINNTVYPKLPPKANPQYMLEVGLVDQHFGMLAWAKETLSDYDLKIAELLYVESVKRAINRIKNPEQIGKILLPIGHDFFHINDQSNTTPRAGHRLDVDGRLAKVFSTGMRAAVKAIDYLSKIAPVEVVYVSGNHDPQMSYYLCVTLQAWYRNCPDIYFDIDEEGIVNPTARKYVAWGKGLLGMSHGLDEKMGDLPAIMANEAKHLWGNAVYKEIHIGHFHKVRSSATFKHLTDTVNQTIVRTLPSLCGSDDYSYAHGWLSEGVQAAEFYLWDKDFGPVQYISVKAEEIL
jgi:hypothetical protein